MLIDILYQSSVAGLAVLLAVTMVTMAEVAPSSGHNGQTKWLPSFPQPLPLLDATFGLGDDNPSDDMLRRQFPGQFFSSSEIRNISRLEIGRKRRQVDSDICCRT